MAALGRRGSCIYWWRMRVMSVDPRMIHLYSYYRDAELRGATLLLKLLMRVEDSEAQVKLSRHLADETRHAWLWTKKIADMGAAPVRVLDGYQTRLGQEIGIPKTLIDLFALTVVVEERAQRRYLEHARRPDVEPDTLEILHEVTKDEKWHIGWIKSKLKELATANGGEEKMLATLERYREIDQRVVAGMIAKEREAFGFSFSDVPD
jgi:rubrerythrin